MKPERDCGAIRHLFRPGTFDTTGESDLLSKEAALANAVLLAPAFHIARYQLGLLQFSSGRAAVALVTWEPLFHLDHAQALGHFVKGFAALAQDEFTQARSHFQAGLVRNTENAALSQDIEKVLRGIDDALAPPAASTSAEAPGKAQASGEAAVHILLSNYGKFGGTLH